MLFFKILTADLTEEILSKSTTTNPYLAPRTLDGKYIMLEFDERDIPVILLKLGYLPLTTEQAILEKQNASWNTSDQQPEIYTPIIRDSEGSIIIKQKVTNNGWSYQLHSIEFTTSTLNSIYSKNAEGNDWGFTTIKCYNSDNEELTTQLSCDLSAVKTVIDWEPTFDYEIIGGICRFDGTINTDVRLWIIGVPDLSSEMGGSKCFCSGVNFKYLETGKEIHIDGRASKMLKYNSTYHTNKIRFILKHNPGVKYNICMITELFKP